MQSPESNQTSRFNHFALGTSLSLLLLAGCSEHSTHDPAPVIVASPPPMTEPTITATARPEVHEPANITLQRTLNSELPGMPKLELDGKLGAQTMRAICAVRFLTGHEASKAAPNSKEIIMLENKQKLSSKLSGLVVSRTCQVMAVNINQHLTMILPVSTGRPGYDTPVISGQIVSGQYGWHNSTLYPDKYGIGNMYKPMYFSGSIAVHGSAEMTPEVTAPESHGCVRVTVSDADKLWELAGGPDHGRQDEYISSLKPISVHVL